MRDVIKFRTVDEYIQLHSGKVAAHLRQIRQVIRKEAPEAEETISYNMPAYKLNGPLVYFAACANHIGFYPIPSAIAAFSKELKEYTTSKGAIQFPIDDPLPVPLIKQIVRFRVMENKEKGRQKTAQKAVKK
jgi:uncharacterized protein YdhG (YjbR/CyaY superfamily)